MARNFLKLVMFRSSYMKLIKNLFNEFGIGNSLSKFKKFVQGGRIIQRSLFTEKDIGDNELSESKSVPKEVSKTKNETEAKKPQDRISELIDKLNLETDKKSVYLKIKKYYQLYKLDECPEEGCEINKCDAVQLYRNMSVIRNLERTSSKLYGEKIIRGFCHLYIGQEAVAVGMSSVLGPNDNVITAYRCHGWCYVMGISVEAILAELAGKSSGIQRGKGGSMHMYTNNFYGGNGIVGAQVPLGVGIALASKYKSDGGVCVTCYGDGAANQGQVFEAYNMAYLWKLPVIFVCENNLYGMGTSTKRSSSSTKYYSRGDYIPGIWVDGMDVIAVRCATTYAQNYVQDNGPIILEMETYRYTGHSMSDPGLSYRSREEVEEIRKSSDPIEQFKQSILENSLLNEEEIKLIDKDIKTEVDEAVNTAKNSKEIDLSELTADVSLNNLEPKIRGVLDWNLRHIQIQKSKNET